MRANSLEDAARALARKVASILNSREAATVSIRNLSSLSPEQVSNLGQIIEEELQSRGHKVSQIESSGAILRVTISENLTGILEIGELLVNGQSHLDRKTHV